ncbi:hypothetical protein ISCGN_025449 [Ixodes scapularis]
MSENFETRDHRCLPQSPAGRSTPPKMADSCLLLLRMRRGNSRKGPVDIDLPCLVLWEQDVLRSSESPCVRVDDALWIRESVRGLRRRGYRGDGLREATPWRWIWMLARRRLDHVLRPGLVSTLLRGPAQAMT